ncbi:MAG: fibronectin type III domain-containing protein [Candidatus Aminicenantales bacterium]
MNSVRTSKKIFIFCLSYFFFAFALQGSQLFQTGQPAEIFLNPYAHNNAIATGQNHPYGVMSDGIRLFIADSRNNRILIWNSMPTMMNQPPDVVVGQPDFTHNESGAGPSLMNWPHKAYSDGKRLFVADTYNNRILIWNHIPTTNGHPADLVLGQPDFDTVRGQQMGPASTNWPWDVLYDGTRLYVVCTETGRVLVWNSLPTRNNQEADLILGRQNFTDTAPWQNPNAWNMATPRSIATNGTWLAISDYNFQRVLIWKTLPTQNGQPADLVLFQDDFYHMNANGLALHHGGLCLKNNVLIVAGAMLYIYNSLPTRNNQWPDVVLAGGDSTRQPFAGSGAWYDGQRLFIADSYQNRTLVYNQLLQNPAAPADLVLGEEDFGVDVFLGKKGIWQIADVFSTGKTLMIKSFSDRIVIHQDLPQQNNEDADNLISPIDFGVWKPNYLGSSVLREPGNQIWSDGVRLVTIANQDGGVQIWNQIPQRDKVLPDIVINPAGLMSGAQGVAMVGNKLFVSDTGHNRILIWNSLPKGEQSTTPDITIQGLNAPAHMATDGQRLAVISVDTGVYIWNNLPTANNQPPDFILKGSPLSFNGLGGIFISDNRLFVSDAGNHRICLYESFPIRSDQPYDVVLGQPDLTSKIAGQSATTLTLPGGLCFDGEYLWVGELKWGDRVVGFKANIPAGTPAAPSNFQATPVSNNRINLNWTDNSSNERGFIVKYRQNIDTAFKIWGYVPANFTSISVDGLEKNRQHVFQISAYNKYGESNSAGPASATTLNQINTPPQMPWNPFPSNGQTMVGILNFLFPNWAGGDDDIGDIVSYDLYLGTTSNPPLFSKGQTSPFYEDFMHKPATRSTYYWKVVAKDLNGGIAESPIWNFQTAPPPFATSLLSISSSQGGTTNPAPRNNYEYDNQDSRIEALVWAIPDAKYSFFQWTGNVPPGRENINPLSITLDANKAITANFAGDLAQPLNFKGEKLINRSLLMIEYIVRLTWQSNPDSGGISSYRIYEIDNDKKNLIGQVNSDKLEFLIRNVQINREYRYAVSAVNNLGWESALTEMSVR